MVKEFRGEEGSIADGMPVVKSRVKLVKGLRQFACGKGSLGR